MSPVKKPKAEAPPDPDKLIRETPGNYHSDDGRFEARQTDVAWYLVDREQTNDFGQELIHGPFATLKDTQAAIAGARKVTPLARPKPAGAARAAKQKPDPKPKSWIDELPSADAKAVGRLIESLEHEGVADAESLVRASRRANGPSLAQRVIEHRLNAISDDAPSAERAQVKALMRGVVEILADDGALVSPPLQRWALVELAPGDPLPPRRLRPKVR